MCAAHLVAINAAGRQVATERGWVIVDVERMSAGLPDPSVSIDPDPDPDLPLTLTRTLILTPTRTLTLTCP